VLLREELGATRHALPQRQLHDVVERHAARAHHHLHRTEGRELQRAARVALRPLDHLRVRHRTWRGERGHLTQAEKAKAKKRRGGRPKRLGRMQDKEKKGGETKGGNANPMATAAGPRAADRGVTFFAVLGLRAALEP
jgi:hypothetical protein